MTGLTAEEKSHRIEKIVAGGGQAGPNLTVKLAARIHHGSDPLVDIPGVLHVLLPRTVLNIHIQDVLPGRPPMGELR